MSRQITTDQIQLSYRFTDPENNPHQFDLTFPRKDLIQHPVVFRPLSRARMLREAAAIQRQYATQQGWRDAELTVRNDELQYKLHQGPTEKRQQRLREWQANYQQAYEDVLHRHYYQTLELHSGRSGYAPDHTRIANESAALIAPLSDALHQRLEYTYGDYTERQALAFITRFIQQIPYDDFSDRLQSPGAGFIPPGRLLYENKGDCDSKVTLLGSIMQNLYPEHQSRVVYLPGHAVFAFESDPEGDDIYLQDNEVSLVVADPTGPALLSVGEVSTEYQSHLRSGAVTMRAF